MKRCAFTLTLTAFALLLFQGAALACTSFAAYASQPIYGMNFDYAQFPMKLLMETHGDLRTFHLAFEKVLGETRFFANTGGMNSEGLFYACQELDPAVPTPPEPSDGDMPLHLLNDIIGRARTVAEVKVACKKVNLIQIPGVTLHTLFADKTGHAVVLEPGAGTHHLTKMTGNRIVMANFANHSLSGKNHHEAKGLGDYRYKIIHEYLQKNISELSVDHGLTLLEKAHNRNPECPTSCSMVFAPESQSIYIAFHRDFSKIWRASLTTGTIETFRGFDTKISHPLNQDGILVSELLR